MSTSPIEFKNIIPQIIPTDTTDVYDVVFTVQMPDEVTASAGTAGTDEDFYCNNKLRIDLKYKFDKNDTKKYFSSNTGQGQQTACVLTPPIEMSKAAAAYSITKTSETQETSEKSQLDLVKASGIYFTTYDKLNDEIKKTFKDTYDKLHTGFKAISDIDTKTKDSLKKSQECDTIITVSPPDDMIVKATTASEAVPQLLVEVAV